MQKFIAICVTALACSAAHAGPWHQFSPEVYTLLPEEDVSVVKMMAAASLGETGLSVRVIDFSERRCTQVRTTPTEPAGVFSVNGTPVRFLSSCSNGTRWLFPETPKGRAFFAESMTTGPVTLELDFGVKLHFNSEGFEEARKAMQNAKSAI